MQFFMHSLPKPVQEYEKYHTIVLYQVIVSNLLSKILYPFYSIHTDSQTAPFHCFVKVTLQYCWVLGVYYYQHSNTGLIKSSLNLLQLAESILEFQCLYMATIKVKLFVHLPIKAGNSIRKLPQIGSPTAILIKY